MQCREFYVQYYCERLHLPLSSIAGQTLARESGLQLLLPAMDNIVYIIHVPALLSSPSLLLPFTHLQPDRLRSLRLNCYGNILLVKTLLPEGLQTYSPSGAVTAHQRTCVTNNI